ncbi:unnamed protein product [Calypogeia fissa]
MENSTVSCMKPMPATSNGVWQHDNPMDFSFPLLVIQITLVLFVTRTLAYLFKPLRQPRVIAEIIGGILLGPTALGRNHEYMVKIFPKQSITVLDLVANIGLLFFMFMVGLELDLGELRRVGSQALAIAGAGMALPFALGVGVSVLVHKTISPGVGFAPFLVFMGVAMSITAFPVLARILAERKLLRTDVGQMAMSAAAVNDVSAWILLALAIALSGTASGTVAIWVLLCGLAFVIFMFLVVKPFMTWVAHQSAENEPIKETNVCITFALVLICGFITDAIGIHLIFGGFVLGLIIPKDGSFSRHIFEKFEDIVSILLLPLYFASSGLKTNVAAIHGAHSWGLLVLVICVACAGKIGGTVLVSRFYTKNFRKSFTLGVLMNTKGLVELIVLNIGKDRGILNDEVFAIMVVMALFTTFITTPTVMTIYRPARNGARNQGLHKREGHKEASPKKKLRVVGCADDIRSVPALVNLTETFREQNQRNIRLYLLHLLQLSERSSSVVMAERAGREESGAHRTDQIAFEVSEGLTKVVVRPMTVVSHFEDMHEDICTTAEEKGADIIIFPFHKKVRLDGTFDGGNSGFQMVNQKVLQYARCPVGILVDRGLWGGGQSAPRRVDHTVVVLFFGGPDDRLALALGVTMAGHSGRKLKVIQYTRPADQGADSSLPELEDMRDEEMLNTVRSIFNNSNKVITLEVVEIINLDESINEVGKEIQHNLILVGRSSHPSSLLASLCQQRPELAHSELGYVGDILASSNSRCSVLVVQQYDPIHLDVSVGPIEIHSGHSSTSSSDDLPTSSSDDLPV